MRQGFLAFTLVMLLGLGILIMRMEDQVAKIDQQVSELEEVVDVVEVVVVAAEPAAPEYQNYWNYEEMFDGKEDELTDLAFEDWERTQEGIKIQVVGKVNEVKLHSSRRDTCMLSVTGPKLIGYQGFHQIMGCEPLRSFTKGDKITLNCVMGDDGIISPDVEECVVQQ